VKRETRRWLQVYCGGDFTFLNVLADFIPADRPSTFLDAGANIGAASILFAHLVALHGGSVLSVEAFPPNFEVLSRNVAPLKETVQTVPKAIVTHGLALSGHMINFTGDSNQFWGFRVDHTNSWRTGTTVTRSVNSVSLPQLQVR
jgi:FkbM family methyltransferase